MLTDEKLRQRGWTDREILHAHKVIAVAESARQDLRGLERVTLALLVATAALGGGAVGALFARLSGIPALAIGGSFILGVCLGFLWRHALLHLRSSLPHRRWAIALSALLAMIASAAVVASMGGDWRLISLPLGIGLVVPALSLGVAE